MSASLEARGAGVRAGERWLARGIDFAIAPGEVVALVGPNGAGKSTVLRLLAGDIAPAEGQVLIDGRPVDAFSPRELALRRAVLPQQTVLEFAFTAREVVTMGRAPRRGDADETVVTRELHRTDALHVAERIYPSLSGGEQARVALSRVLAQEAPILLLDEPTASLDLRHQQMIMEVGRQIAAAGGLVVVILHDLNLAAAFGDRVCVMRDGRIVADGVPWQTMTETLLSDVFDCKIAVHEHPVRGCPLIIPLATA
jgi:iron complex transport system ATP-binding protein